MFPGHREDIDKAVTKEVTGLTSIAMEEVAEDKQRDIDMSAVATLISRHTLKYEGSLFTKAKLRCCCPGQNETEGEGCHVSASAVPRLSTLRAFLAITPKTKQEVVMRADVAQAYLKSALEPIPRNEQRYVAFAGDISPRHQNGERKVYRLTRSLYGIFQW